MPCHWASKAMDSLHCLSYMVQWGRSGAQILAESYEWLENVYSFGYSALWHGRVSTRICWYIVTRLDKICNFCLNVAARDNKNKRVPEMYFAGCWQVQQPNNTNWYAVPTHNTLKVVVLEDVCLFGNKKHASFSAVCCLLMIALANCSMLMLFRCFHVNITAYDCSKKKKIEYMKVSRSCFVLFKVAVAFL